MGDSAPQDEGFHYYQLVIDGAFVPDPGSLYFYGAGRWGSGVEVPAKDQEFYALKNVPHGQVSEKLYYSELNTSMRRCFVYTPPGYEQDTGKRYPVVYLQHGGGGLLSEMDRCCQVRRSIQTRFHYLKFQYSVFTVRYCLLKVLVEYALFRVDWE